VGDNNGRTPAADEGTGASPRRPHAWQRWLGVGAAILGLYLTVTTAIRLIHRAEGYAPGDADCDDCGVTLVLDNIGWLAAAVVSYLGLVLLAWWLLRGRGRSHTA
jgi:hypothetical protein